MSATSGIPASADLLSTFARLNRDTSTTPIRFLKVSISNESLVSDGIVQAQGSFEDDLGYLLSSDVLDDDVPAYVLAKKGPSDWVAISYVPDTARVRDKLLYSSTRSSLLKSFGSSVFSDSIFATCKQELSSEAYALRNKRHQGSTTTRETQPVVDHVSCASTPRVNHFGSGVGLHWSPEVESAVREMGEGDDDGGGDGNGGGNGNAAIVLRIDPKSATLHVKSTSDVDLGSLKSTISCSEPCYVVYAWSDATLAVPKRIIIFIYSCPSNASVKDKMVYSSAVSSTFGTIKDILLGASRPVDVVPRKIEISNPTELDEEYVLDELRAQNVIRSRDRDRDRGGRSVEAFSSLNVQEQKPFAKPKGPGRRR